MKHFYHIKQTILKQAIAFGGQAEDHIIVVHRRRRIISTTKEEGCTPAERTMKEEAGST
mgnify:CR=1 FL=1